MKSLCGCCWGRAPARGKQKYDNEYPIPSQCHGLVPRRVDVYMLNERLRATLIQQSPNEVIG